MKSNFKKSGQSVAERIAMLAPTESFIIELDDPTDSFEPAMRSISATATKKGIKITQAALTCTEPNSIMVVKAIRVQRVS